MWKRALAMAWARCLLCEREHLPWLEPGVCCVKESTCHGLSLVFAMWKRALAIAWAWCLLCEREHLPWLEPGVCYVKESTCHGLSLVFAMWKRALAMAWAWRLLWKRALAMAWAWCLLCEREHLPWLEPGVCYVKESTCHGLSLVFAMWKRALAMAWAWCLLCERESWYTTRIQLLKSPWMPDGSELPSIIQPKGLSPEQQGYLHYQIGPFCPENDRNITCPFPTVPKPVSSNPWSWKCHHSQ